LSGQFGFFFPCETQIWWCALEKKSGETFIIYDDSICIDLMRGKKTKNFNWERWTERVKE